MTKAQAVVIAAPEPAAPVSESVALIQVIERAAQNPQVDLDKMERLLAMQERIVSRNAQSAYADALAQMQDQLPVIAERGAIRGRDGKVQSKYSLWEDVVGAITPILSRHGFSLSFRTASDAQSVTVTGVLTHRAGHAEQTSLTLPIDTSGSKNAVQSIGSSTSYGKRYTASALLNLRTGETDDDGQAGPAVARITAEQAADLEAMVSEVGADREKFLRYLGVASLDDVLPEHYGKAVAALNAKRRG